MEPTPFGTLLKRLRMGAQLTQEALAGRANLSVRAISDLERGLSRVPRYDTIDLLAQAMGLSVEQRAALVATARPSAVTKAVPLQVLPFPPTALQGREREVSEALNLLQEREAPLLTLTGPGGVGKTRLALELAHTLRDNFADGLAWIDLTSLRDPSLVPQVVAHTLGLHEQADHSFSEQVCVFLQNRRFLLLLDNFEHLLDAADFVADLLTRCPHVSILVTSRTPLHLRSEQQLVLAPLSQAAAVALFRERAQRLQPSGDYAESTVAAICDQVDRLPLAIELAAALVRVLALPMLLTRLSDQLHVLRGGARDLPERQRTMQEAVAWSYNLLSPMHQRWFRALSIFSGGFTLAAAESLCCEEEPISSAEGLSTIAALVDASLIQAETAGDGLVRYRLLEVIREYAAEQLRAAGEEERYQRRHAEYYAVLAEEAERIGSGQGSREAHLESESANGRAALHWAYERGEVTLGLRLATWFGFFWITRGHMSEANMWLSRMLALDAAGGTQAAPPAVRSRALCYAARLTMHLGERDLAVAFAQEALALAERTGDQGEVSYALSVLGSIMLASGKEDEAAAHFTESYAAAIRARDAGDGRNFSLALLNLGELARRRGDVASAAEFLEEALVGARANDMTWGVANILTLLGHVARQQLAYERAKVYYRESLGLYQRLGNVTYSAWCLEGVAAVACAEGSYQHAATLCAAAAALRSTAQTPLPPKEEVDFDIVAMSARAELDETNFLEQWTIGSAMSHNDAIAYAMIGPLASATQPLHSH